MLLAQCCENDVVPYVLPFVEENINAEMWQRRDAAVMAFGKAGFRVLSPGQTRKHCCGNIVVETFVILDVSFAQGFRFVGMNQIHCDSKYLIS